MLIYCIRCIIWDVIIDDNRERMIECGKYKDSCYSSVLENWKKRSRRRKKLIYHTLSAWMRQGFFTYAWMRRKRDLYLETYKYLSRWIDMIGWFHTKKPLTTHSPNNINDIDNRFLVICPPLLFVFTDYIKHKQLFIIRWHKEAETNTQWRVLLKT
jgi:hypothetical protein